MAALLTAIVLLMAWAWLWALSRKVRRLQKHIHCKPKPMLMVEAQLIDGPKGGTRQPVNLLDLPTKICVPRIVENAAFFYRDTDAIDAHPSDLEMHMYYRADVVQCIPILYHHKGAMPFSEHKQQVMNDFIEDNKL